MPSPGRIFHLTKGTRQTDTLHCYSCMKSPRVCTCTINCITTFLLPEPLRDTYARRAEARQLRARALGTIKNYKSAVRHYIQLCLPLRINPLAPTVYDVCIWLEALMDDNPDASPDTICNKVANIRQYVLLSNGDTTGLHHVRVQRALDAIKRDSTFVPMPKSAIPLPTFKLALQAIPRTQVGALVRAALLLIFYAGLRPSEVAPPSAPRFDPAAHLTRADITFSHPSLVVRIRKAKNQQLFNQTKTRTLAPAPAIIYCPVQNTALAIALSPTVSPAQAMFTYPSSTRPISVVTLRRVWADALTHIGVPPKQYTLYSIRKAASTTAFQMGCSQLEIQRFGGWSSEAYRAYITTRDSVSVNKAITHAFASQ